MSYHQVPQAVRDRAVKIVADCIAKANKHFGRTYDIPNVLFDLRGRVGGCAQGTSLIRLNSVLLMENLEEYYTQVIPHEVAHCIDTANGDNARPYSDYGFVLRNGRRMKRSIHGPSWQHIMRAVFGLEPSRCHQMDTTNAAVRTKTKYEYKCKSCNKSFFVSSVRHNKQRAYAASNAGASFYTCNGCGRARGALIYVANLGKVSVQQARAASAARKQPAFQPPVLSAYDPAPANKQVLKPKSVESKGAMDIARKIMVQYGFTLTRGQFLVRAVEAGLKETTASTYYNTLKRK